MGTTGNLTESRPTSYRGVGLREPNENDDEFLYRLFAATHAALVAAFSHWDGAQKAAFLRLQYEAQSAQYAANYAQARVDIVVAGRDRIGRFYVAPLDDEMRLVDISLLPEHRNRGIGRALIQDLIDEAARSQQRVTLHVEQTNPARHLYARLGFVSIRDEGPFAQMEWAPPVAN